MVTKLKKNVDKTQKLLMWQNWKTQIVTKLKKSTFDNTQQLKMLQNSNIDKTQIVKKNANFDKTQQLKLWQINKNSKCDKTCIMTNLHLWEEKQFFL